MTTVKRSGPNTFGSPCIMHLTCDGVTGAPTLGNLPTITILKIISFLFYLFSLHILLIYYSFKTVKTSYSNDSVSALGAVTYGDGVGIVGVTNKPFPGNLQSSAQDIYFGTGNFISSPSMFVPFSLLPFCSKTYYLIERTSYSQYGFPVDTTQAFAYITSPLTLYLF